MITQTMQQAVGRTAHPRVRSPDAPGARMYAKLEGCSPTGSVVDRGGLRMIQAAVAAGTLRPKNVDRPLPHADGPP